MIPNSVKDWDYLDDEEVVIFPSMTRRCECECECPAGLWSTDPAVTICAYCENPELLGVGGTKSHEEALMMARYHQHPDLKEM